MVEKITMNSECHIILNCNNVNGIHDSVGDMPHIL